MLQKCKDRQQVLTSAAINTDNIMRMMPGWQQNMVNVFHGNKLVIDSLSFKKVSEEHIIKFRNYGESDLSGIQCMCLPKYVSFRPYLCWLLLFLKSITYYFQILLSWSLS